MLNKTVCGDLELHHEVEWLGEGVAENVANLIHVYAERASLRDVPVMLNGSAWQKPWAEISSFIPVFGNAGSSFEEEARGDVYTCLELMIPDKVSPRWIPDHLHPQNVESTIAHEITHLRWWRLRHGPEFDARTLGLLRGAKFPAGGGWSQATHEIMRTARIETAKFLRDQLEKLPHCIQ
jgi:hypothetical protein